LLYGANESVRGPTTLVIEKNVLSTQRRVDYGN
jgi:hypothetical protein